MNRLLPLPHSPGSDCDGAEQDETIDDMEPDNAEIESDTELD